MYVHIPFCARRCDYCAFATWTDRAHLMESYAQAVRADLAGWVEAGLPPAATVFFGGGTPSLLPSGLLSSILADIPRRADAEVTVECNPENVDEALMASYARAGVNRVSIGVQSMDPATLRSLGRVHAVGSVAEAVRHARGEGIENVNLDLIYGAAGETRTSWTATLNAALELGPTHVSAYALTVEAGTPLARSPQRHPDEDLQADLYALADRLLAESGYRWYEISNWCRPGRECRHNLLYWSGGDYLGLGCAAHSQRRGTRWWNVHTPERYVTQVGRGASVRAGEETLDDSSRRRERLMLALRTRTGIPAAAITGNLEDLEGLLEVENGHATLSLRGRLLANEVAVRL